MRGPDDRGLCRDVAGCARDSSRPWYDRASVRRSPLNGETLARRIVDWFIFRTAVPFGYLAFWGGLVVLSGASVGIVIRSLRPFRKRRMVAGSMLFAALALLGAVNVFAEQKLDFNPLIRERGDLVGVWKDGTATLDLRADGTFLCQGDGECSGVGPTGAWTWHDFEVKFRSIAGRTVVRRILRYGQELRLASLPDDPDVWDGRLSFRRPRVAG